MRQKIMIFLLTGLLCCHGAASLAGPVPFTFNEYSVYAEWGNVESGGLVVQGPNLGNTSVMPIQIEETGVKAKASATDAEVSASSWGQGQLEGPSINSIGYAKTIAFIHHEFNHCSSLALSFTWETSASVGGYFEDECEIEGLPSFCYFYIPPNDVPASLVGKGSGEVWVTLQDLTNGPVEVWNFTKKVEPATGSLSESGSVSQAFSLTSDHTYALELGTSGYADAWVTFYNSSISAAGEGILSDITISCVPLTPTLTLLASGLMILIGMRKTS